MKLKSRVKFFIISYIILLVQLSSFLFAEISDKLHKGFSKAFSSAQEFQATRLFDILGYSVSQIQQIVEVTPRPASLSVKFVQVDQNGGFSEIKVFAQKVKYYNLTIDHACFSFPDVELDQKALSEGNIRFRKVSRIEIETFVSEKDILKVFELVARAKQLSKLQLKILPTVTHLSGRVKKGLFLVAFDIKGIPRLQDSKKIIFQCNKMILNGVPLPRNVINAIFSQINPVFNANQTWLNLELLEIFMEKGFVRSRGIIHPQINNRG